MEYQNTASFSGKTRVVLLFMGIIPFLLIMYLFWYERLNLSDATLIFSALALFCILTGFTLMRNSADQLVHLAVETGLVQAGQKSELVCLKADKEVNDIAAHFNSILQQLTEANRDIKEQNIQLMAYARDLAASYERIKKEEDIRNKLSRYVGKNLLEKLMDSKGGVLFENERKEVTILFADIRSFTALSEKMMPEKVVAMLNEYFGTMADIVFKNNGVLDKFVGDQLMAVFGFIDVQKGGPCDAVNAAIEMQLATEMLMRKRAAAKKETFQIGIGINTGSAIVGNVGSENRMDYTVIGDSVNAAAKLEQIAKGGEIIIGERTHRQTGGRFPLEGKMRLSIKNRTEPVICYRLKR